ncbi:hypothetical protein [Paenibacillus sp. E194]|uniref:hypothetical protein n=1 Tax=Paenibacillus sp. E194 TaxID=1458845 RepID=UPI0012E0253C|nr:hypothetical protein [Paenibacillus sp. E194]
MNTIANILVAEKINYDHKTKKHSLNNVVNSIQVNIFPSVIITDVHLKFLLPSSEFNTSYKLVVYAPDHVVVFSSLIIEVKNYRLNCMMPGMDAAVNVKFAVTEEGTYRYCLLDENNIIISEYPLYISLSE